MFNCALTDQQGVNKLVTLKSYHLSAEHLGRETQVDFTIAQFRLLERIGYMFNLDNFLKKLVIIHPKPPFITIDLNYFEHIDDNCFNFMMKPVRSDSKRISNILVKVT